jgi:tetratricopeptide (TPR) repeat protein
MQFRASLLFPIVFIAASALAQYGGIQPYRNSIPDGMRLNLSGSIRDMNGVAVRDARIEISEASTGRLMATTFTSIGGTFEVSNLAPGQYEVVATSGLAETRSKVDLGIVRDISLRMPMSRTASNDNTTGSKAAVSVSQMQVPGKARKLFQKAIDAFHKARIDDAFGFVQQALGLYPDYAKALTLRGVLNLQKGDTKSAQPDLEKAVELDYSDDASFVALATLYNNEHRFDEALRILDRGLTIHPDSWSALLENARADLGKHEFDSALTVLARAEKYVPAEINYWHLYRAQAFIGMKNFQIAQTELEAFLSKEPIGPNSDTARKILSQLKGLEVPVAAR